MWIILGVVQLITVYGALAGIWNIIAGWSRISESLKIRERHHSIPSNHEGVAGLVVIGLINLFLGGIIGLIFVGFDFFVRDKILTHRALFNRMSPNQPVREAIPDTPAKTFPNGEGWLILARDNKTYGPYAGADLRTFAEEGRIFPDTLVRQEKQTRWTKLEKTSLHQEIFASRPINQAQN